MPKPTRKFDRVYKTNSNHIDDLFVHSIFCEWLKSRPPKKFEKISPSMIGHCARCMFYALKEVPQTTPPGLGNLATFEVGRWSEEAFGKVFKDQKVLVHHFRDDTIKGKDAQFAAGNMKGKPDFLLLLDNNLYVVDAKTQRSDSFGWTGTTQDELRESKKEYWAQTLAYIWLLRKNADRLVKDFGVTPEQVANLKGLVFFYSKDDGVVKRELLIDPTKGQLDWVEERANYLWGFIERNELPPCECEGWLIQYCNYGNPLTRETNKQGKIVNTECCDPSYVGVGVSVAS